MNNLNKKGFSMIELIVVISIVAIMLAIAVPKFYLWSDNLKCKEAAWDISAQLRLARQMAVTNNNEYGVAFKVSGKQYVLTVGNPWAPLNGASSWKSLESTVKWATGTPCNGTADTYIGFKPNGTATAGVICVQDTGSTLKYTVTVNQTTGRAYVE